MPSVVVDASLALKWVVPEPASARAADLRDSWRRAGVAVIAPVLISSEVANGLLQRVRGGYLSLGEAGGALRDILTGIRLEPHPAVAIEALILAARNNLPAVYDAHYLALAEREGCELWTSDGRFWRAVREKFPGVKLLESATDTGAT